MYLNMLGIRTGFHYWAPLNDGLPWDEIIKGFVTTYTAHRKLYPYRIDRVDNFDFPAPDHCHRQLVFATNRIGPITTSTVADLPDNCPSAIDIVDLRVNQASLWDALYKALREKPRVGICGDPDDEAYAQYDRRIEAALKDYLDFSLAVPTWTLERVVDYMSFPGFVAKVDPCAPFGVTIRPR